MKISTKGRYALEAVLDLAFFSKSGLESLKNVSDRLNISKNYLEQIFVILRNKGIVESVRGAQGGYMLAKQPSEITVGDVIRALEGNLSPVSCVDDDKEDKPCENATYCVTRKLWKNLKTVMDETVDSITIEDLLKSYGQMYKKDNIDYSI